MPKCTWVVCVDQSYDKSKKEVRQNQFISVRLDDKEYARFYLQKEQDLEYLTLKGVEVVDLRPQEVKSIQ